MKTLSRSLEDPPIASTIHQKGMLRCFEVLRSMLKILNNPNRQTDKLMNGQWKLLSCYRNWKGGILLSKPSLIHYGYDYIAMGFQNMN